MIRPISPSPLSANPAFRAWLSSVSVSAGKCVLVVAAVGVGQCEDEQGHHGHGDTDDGSPRPLALLRLRHWLRVLWLLGMRGRRGCASRLVEDELLDFLHLPGGLPVVHAVGPHEGLLIDAAVFQLIDAEGAELLGIAVKNEILHVSEFCFRVQNYHIYLDCTSVSQIFIIWSKSLQSWVSFW